MTQVAEQITFMANHLQQQQAAVDLPPWLEALRKAGADRFHQAGFPTGKDEEWRHTSVAAIARTPFKPAGRPAPELAAEASAQFSFGDEASCELIFVNGQFVPALSHLGKLPRGVTAGPLAKALQEDPSLLERTLGRYADIEKNPFVALNTGLLRDGAFIHVARGAVVERPIHLLFISTAGDAPQACHPRTLAVVEDGAEVSFVESYVGAGRGVSFTNAVTEIAVGADARIDHCKLQQESLQAFHVSTTQTHLARGASFVSHSATLGAKLSRNDLNVTMSGPGAEATVNGLVIVGGDQHADNHTMLDHAQPDCPSHELYKHVLDGRAHAVFKGKILVRQAGQRTDSKQTSKTLLLSDDALMHSQPALEIYADDVKCTHGSTTGPVDEEQVFYLRSRGVSLEASRHLLTYAFAADITRRIRVEPVRRRIEAFMAAQHGLPQDLRITDLGHHDEASR